MIRYLLWFLIFYFVWRIIKTIITIKQRSQSHKSAAPPFPNIEEAHYEDVTNKSGTEHTPSTENTKETPPSD